MHGAPSSYPGPVIQVHSYAAAGGSRLPADVLVRIVEHLEAFERELANDPPELDIGATEAPKSDFYFSPF